MTDHEFERYHRRSIRLKVYDYRRCGAYFITVCVQNRFCLFGEIVDGVMKINEAGQIAQNVWNDLPRHYPHMVLDAWVIMPNHVHGIIFLSDVRDDGEPMPPRVESVGAGFKPAPTGMPDVRDDGEPMPPRVESVGAGFKPAHTHGLPEIVRAFKTFSARRINPWRHTPGTPVWQRNYYEHIIRNEESLHRIRQYIADNPARWTEDRNHPDAIGRRV
ncbi:MAG: transposase [candidate division Zixibacteria bacterium]|nr:transposase [candidate division Zixibacteria bacterium]